MKKTLLFLTFLFNFSLYAQGTCATALTVVSGSTYNTGVINGTHIGGCYTGTVPTNGIWYTFTTTAAGFMRINTNIPSNPTTGGVLCVCMKNHKHRGHEQGGWRASFRCWAATGSDTGTQADNLWVRHAHTDCQTHARTS